MKNAKVIISGVVFTAALLGAAWLALTPRTAETSGTSTALAAVETSYDFGVISMAKGKVSHTFTLKNESAGSVRIIKIYTSCMCTTATLHTVAGESGPFGMSGMPGVPLSPVNATIAPGEDATLSVEFDPAAHGPEGVGVARRIVYVEAGGQKPVEVSFQATVTL
jgi:hypothetical protein